MFFVLENERGFCNTARATAWETREAAENYAADLSRKYEITRDTRRVTLHLRYWIPDKNRINKPRPSMRDEAWRIVNHGNVAVPEYIGEIMVSDSPTHQRLYSGK